MKLTEFKLETFLSQHEFKAPHLLCCSDAESVSMGDVIHLASAEEKSLWDNLWLGYTEAAGAPLLREAIRKNLYPELSSSDNILVFSGAEEGIFCALSSLVAPGDHVIVLAPCYQSLAEIPKAQGAEVSLIQLQESEDWRVNVDEIKSAIKNNTKMIVINFPHNPTGQIITDDEISELVKVCRAHDLWLFSDEVYRLLGKPRTPWAKPAAVHYEKALSLGVMSKALGMAGLRIGWIACQNRNVLNDFEKIKHYTSICCSGPSEVISVIALNNKEKFLMRNNAIVESNLALIESFIDEYRDQFQWVSPQGGCVGFVKYKNKKSVEDFCLDLLKKRGVLLLPASIYDRDSNHFRIGFGRKNMPEALAQLRGYVRDEISM